MPSRKLEDADLILQSAFRVALNEYPIKYSDDPTPFITCTHRSEQEQAELYALGRTKKGKIVTQLKKGSKHNFYPAKAVDIAFKKKDGSLDWSESYFAKFAALIKSYDSRIEWGGEWKRFKDLPHFQID